MQKKRVGWKLSLLYLTVIGLIIFAWFSWFNGLGSRAAFAAGTISGTVFRDYDGNGTIDVSEPGVSGVEVRAYDADGNNVTPGGVVLSSGTNGAYSFATTDAGTGPYRVEFTIPSSLSYLYFGPQNSSNGLGTSVQFITTTPATVDFSVHNPAEYCDDDPELATSCYVNGDTSGAEDVLVQWDYDLRGVYNVTPNNPPPDHIAGRNQIGSTWGLAYDRQNELLYSAAFLKRHVGLTDGLGAIFVTDPFAGVNNGSLFLDLAAAPFNIEFGDIGTDVSRGLPVGATTPSNDPLAYFANGKFGLGDMEISEDGTMLWFVNLYDQTVYSLERDSDNDPNTAPTLADLQSYPVPTNQCNSYSSIFINAGGPEFTTVATAWNGDGYFVGGSAGTIAGQSPPYNTNRSATSFNYMVPVPNGNYDVTLHARATTATNYSVTIEGVSQVFSFAANTNATQTRSVTVNDGAMILNFGSATQGTPLISGIQITATTGQEFTETHAFGLKIHDGATYVGVVCTGEYSQSTTDLDAYIFRLPYGSSSYQQAATFSLEYEKGAASTNGTCADVSNWHPWALSFPAPCSGTQRTVWPQPSLVGIEFHLDNSLVVVIMDRFGHQTGNFNHVLSGTEAREGVIGGEILRIYNNNGTYELESNATAGPLTANWLTSDNGVGNGEGPGGGEFYQDDVSPPRSHREIPVGGIAYWYETGEMAVMVMDPVGDGQSGGVMFFNNTTGATTTDSGDTSFDGYEIYQSDGGPTTFGKANGTGDLELLCKPAPIEIGNRLWYDTDGDGVQDPDEPVLGGVTVGLYDMDNGGTLIGSTTTDANGNYYFSNVTCSPEVGSVTAQVSAGNNDAEETISSGSVTTTSNDLEFGEDNGAGGTPLATGMRFTGVSIPDGAIITSAYIQFTSDGNQSGSTSLVIRGEDADTSAAFTTGTGNITNRADTTASVNWNPAAWSDNESGADTQTPDLSTIVQEIVDRPGWDDDSMSFVITGTGYRDAQSYDQDPATAPQLFITYIIPCLATTTPIEPNTNYEVRIDLSQPALNGLQPTRANGDASTNGDVRDSDGVTNGNTVVAAFNTGLSGDNDHTFDFGFTELGAIGNYVWVDENNDGYQDAGEPGIPNVLVILTEAGDDNQFGTADDLVYSTYTDTNGGYLFDDLPPGDYRVTIPNSNFGVDAALEGMTQTINPILTGSDFGNQSLNGGTGYEIRLEAGEENLTADFGYNYNTDTEVNLPPTNALAAIGDHVWVDIDGDGFQDQNEVGIPDVELTLVGAGADGQYGTGDDTTATTTTDATGYYIFDDLPPGSYTVTVNPATLPAGYVQTGDPDSFGTTGPGDNSTTVPVILGPGDVFLNADFGYQPTGTTGTIGDTVWFDANASGTPTLDTGEYGIPNVTVALIQDTNGDGLWDGDGADNVLGTADDEPILATDITDNNGLYLFAGLPLTDWDGVADEGDGADYIVLVNDTNNVLDGLSQTYDDDGVLATPDQSATAISAGTPSDLDQDFSYSASTPYGTIGDTIWADLNNSGGDQSTQGSEPGLAGVTVELYADQDGDGNYETLVATTTTDVNGNYEFTNLPFDSYEVVVDIATLPVGYSLSPSFDADGGGDSSSVVTLTVVDPNNFEQDFSYPLNNSTGVIGDTVWGDLNSNGSSTPDAGEPGLAGVDVYLYQDTNENGVLDAGDLLIGTDTTDLNGNYLFTGLSLNDGNGDADYLVVIDTNSLPNGYSTTSTYDATSPVNNSESAVALSGGSPINLNQDFSYPPSANPLGSIGDTIWFDANNSGGDQSTQGTEPGLGGVIVELYDSTGTILLATTATDPNGNYLFQELTFGTYIVRVDTSSLPSYVSPNSTYDGPDGGNNSQSSVTISGGSPHNRAQDFSYPPQAAPGAIGDTVWLDLNGDGDQDANEPGIEGVIVNLTDADGNLISTTTDENGNYYFGNLDPDAQYTVTIDPDNFVVGGVLEGLANTADPDGGNDGTSNADLGALGGDGNNDPDGIDNGVNLGQDFGYTPAGAGNIGNLLWLDVNADGNYDPNGADGIPSTADDETPIGGVTIDLYRDLNGNGRVDPGEPLIGSTITSGTISTFNGDPTNYLFTDLPTTDNGFGATGADYVVDVSDADGVLHGYWHSLGTTGATNNSQLDPYAASISAGTPDNLTADFGYYLLPADIGNLVWFDLDGDGSYDVGEPGIPGIDVTLEIVYPNGTLTTLVVTTDSNGNYNFGNLLLDEDYNLADVNPDTPTFTVSVNTPTDMISTTESLTTVTNDDQTDNDSDGADEVATVAEGESDPAYDFGFYRADLGDLPDAGTGTGNNDYNTELADNGAIHTVWDVTGDGIPDSGAIWLGAVVDSDTDGQPNGSATGDDSTDGTDDEDGILDPVGYANLTGGTWGDGSGLLQATQISGSGDGWLVIWIDWNGDGDFDDTIDGVSELVVAQDVSAGTPVPNLVFTSPTSTEFGGTYVYPGTLNARVRLFTDDQLTAYGLDPNNPDLASLQTHYEGLASNGEIEDYQWPFTPTAVTLQQTTVAPATTNWLAITTLLLAAASLVIILYRRRWVAR